MAELPLVPIDRLPSSVDEFVALRDRLAQTPQGGAAMMVLALLAFARDEQVGTPCLTVAVDRGRLHESPDESKVHQGYKGWQLSVQDLQRIQLQIKGKEYLPRSYIQGATPENGYALPSPPFTIGCSDNPYSGDVASGTYKVFVQSSGADSPRPVTLKRNDKGIWKAAEWSSLIVGVRPPAKKIEDDL